LYSVWRDRERPPHGILHAVWAFSTVALLLGRLAESSLLTPGQLAQCAARRETEVDRLRAGRASWERVQELNVPTDVVDMVETQRLLALA